MSGFRLTWRGESWTDADVLAMDLVSVQLVLGGDLENFDPWTGPAQVIAFLAALSSRTSGRLLEEVVEEVRHASAEELMSAIEPRGDD